MQECAFSRSGGHLRSLYRTITFGQCHTNTELHNRETHGGKTSPSNAICAHSENIMHL